MKKRRHIIRLDHPARHWDDGLPVGNGRLGAMVMGKPDEETIIINEETIWYGPDRNRKNPDTKNYLKEIRRLLVDGDAQKAQFLAKMAMTSTPKYMNPYQPAGDLRICFYNHKYQVNDYRRWLDLENAAAYVSYCMEGIHYSREHFTSHKYQVIAIKLTSDKKKGITFCVNLNRKPFEEYSEKLSNHTICSYGECGKGGICYFTGARLTSKGGTVAAIGDFTYVNEADTAYIYVACGTDFTDSKYREKCLERLDAAEAAGYEQIYREHLADYTNLYGRMDLQLSAYALPDLPADELLRQVKEGKYEYRNYLTETLFHYARYLMISSTYDCIMPSNLQGIWNGEYVPPWQSEFTININTEMNYWMAEKCNLPECHLPLFQQLKRMVPQGRKTAELLYGCKGFCAHHNTNIWGNTDPEGIFDASPIWPMGAAWLTLHLYEHYEYTRDLEFLKSQALPIMREAIRFFEDYLYETKKGELVTGPSVSPENTYYTDTGGKAALCMGPAMDIQILRQLFTNYLEACEILGVKDDDRETIANILSRLPKTKITADGRIMEWQEDYKEAEPGHRHVSHLFALYPGYEITSSQKDLFDAAGKTLEARLQHGGGHTGWSCAWTACLYARLGDGKKVGETINKMLCTCINNNLLDTHPPFQIDGNFGIADAILESLAQAHNGCLEFLPALPEFLKEEGQIRGMILKGGIMADYSWRDGVLTELRLTAKEDTDTVIRMDGKDVAVHLAAGQLISIIRSS